MEQSIQRTGRPPRLSRSDEWELYCYRKSGMSIKTCAGMWRVSVPTANRIIAKFREHDDVIGPAWEAYKAAMKAILPAAPTPPPKPREPRRSSPERRMARFWRKVSHAHERGRCWLWVGYTKSSGHGLTKSPIRRRSASSRRCPNNPSRMYGRSGCSRSRPDRLIDVSKLRYY